MTEFLQFIRDHYHVIAECTLTLIVLFVTLFKKKVKINDAFELVLKDLPGFIIEAEKLDLDGPSKYSFVFNRCVEKLYFLTGLKSEEILKKYTAEINEAIENILSTPQKKER